MDSSSNIRKAFLKEKLETGKPFNTPVPLILLQNSGTPVEDTPWVSFDFRYLTGRYLGEDGYFLDFSKENLLKEAIPLFLMKNQGGNRKKPLTFVRNHSFKEEDILGYNFSTELNESDETEQIIGTGRLHSQLAEKEIVKLTTDPPLLQSISLSMYYTWEQSHPDLSFWRFIDLLGMEVDGEIVRLIVSKILEVYHVGMVWEGADDQAVKLWSKYMNDFKQFNLSGKDKIISAQETEGDIAMKELVAKIKSKLDIEKDEGIDKRIDTLLEAEKQNEILQSKNTELTKQIEEQKTVVEMGKQYKEDLKQDVFGLTGLVLGDLSESMKSLIESADVTKLKELRTEFEEKADNLYPARCQDCGSTNVSLRSSREELSDTTETVDVDEQRYSIRDLKGSE